MRQSLKRVISSLLTVSTALALTGVGLVPTAKAGRIQQASAELGDVRSIASTQHKITFNTATQGSLTRIKFQYTNTASGSTAVPTALVSDGSTLAAITIGGADDLADWTLDDDTNGTLIYTRSTGLTVNAGVTIIVTTTGITNNQTVTDSSQCDAVVDSDSCWIRINTYQTLTYADLDSTTITYTVINPVTVTATVDPILTFTVSAVTAGQITANDGNAGAGTGMTSTSTTLPFGNLTVGTPKILQHRLNVLTNANNGYYVYYKFVGATGNLTDGVMTGTYGANNIDVYGAGSSWAAPVAWTAPTGTSNSTNAAWIGIRTSDYRANAGPNHNVANVYAPPAVNNTVAVGTNPVMRNPNPDNGTAETFVTYKIQANAYQASDLYTGTGVYNVLATY